MLLSEKMSNKTPLKSHFLPARTIFYVLGILLTGILVFSLYSEAHGSSPLAEDPPMQPQSDTLKPAAKTLRVGVYHFKPLVFIEADGSAQGLYIDVLNYIAEEEGWVIHYIPCTWAECLASVERGDLDLLPSVGYTEERAKKLDYPQEYLFMDWGVIYANDSQSIDSLLELENKRIAALKGSIYTQGLRQLLDQFDIHADFVEKDEYTEVLAAVNSGEVQAGVIAKTYGLELEDGYQHIHQTVIVYSPVKIYFALPKGKDPELLKTLNQYFAALKEDKNSIYYQSFKKWMGLYDGPFDLPAWTIWVFAGLGLLVCLASLFSVILRRQVVARTRLLEMEIQRRKQIEQSLQESNQRFTLLADSIPEYMAYVNVETLKYEFVNKPYEIFFSLPREKIIGSHIKDVISAANYEFALKYIDEVRAGRSASYENSFRLSNGNRWIRVHYSPVFDSRGAVISIAVLSTDITERKKAEDALRESEVNLNTLIENTDGSIWAVDLQYALIVGNQTFHNNTSAALGRRLNKGESVLLPSAPAKINALWQGYYDRALRGEVFSIETLTYFRPNPRQIEYRFSPIRDAAGEMRGVTVYGRDVTERRQAEDTLKTLLAETLKRQTEIKALLASARAILEQDDFKLTAGHIFHSCKGLVGATAGCVMLISPDGQGNQVLLFDPETPDCPPTSILPMPICGLHGEACLKKQAICDNDFSHSEWASFLPNGHIRFDNVLIVPLVVNGATRGLLELANKPGGFDQNDIRTAAVFGELASVALRNSWTTNQLRESREDFQRYFTMSTVGMAVTSPEKGWLEVNDHLCQMLGYSIDELRTLTWAELTHPDDLEADVERFQQVLADQCDSYRLDKRFIRKDKGVVSTTLYASCHRNPDRSVRYFQTAIVDITDRRRAEEKILAALAEKEILLRELNHRTKNNLNIVGALIGLQAEVSNNEPFRALAQTLKDRLHSIALVHQMLYRSKNLAQVDLGQYAHELAANLASGFAIAHEKVEVIFDVMPVVVGINAAIPCGQILNELISNAFKYAFPNGRSGQVKIQIQQAWDGEITLCVSDNGVGLPENFDQTRTDSLGMSIIRMLAGQLDGSLSFGHAVRSGVSAGDGMSCEVRFRAAPHGHPG